MNLDTLEAILAKTSPQTVVASVMHYFSLNVNAFLYTREDLATLKIIVVLKNTGGVSFFKLLNGAIVVDHLDPSYASSRELICLGDWNIKKVYQVSFQSDRSLTLSEISNHDLRLHLCTLIEPPVIKYLAIAEDFSHPVKLLVDTSLTRGMSYKCLRKYMTEAYLHNLSSCDSSDLHLDTLNYLVVSYRQDQG